MKEPSDMIVCVVDHGQFIPIAEALGRQVKKCYYTSPAERSMPLLQEGVIGDGFTTFERVESLWAVKKDAGLFIFPDLGFADEQKELISQGFPVWGARTSDSLEINRGKFLKTIKALGMEIPQYETKRGITALREFLRDKKDKYIKISKWRGNFETFHWSNWEENEGDLDFYAVEFGPFKEDILFYVFDSIDAIIEDGIDTYCIDGKFPSIVLRGTENKDKSFIGTVSQWDDIPDWLRSVNEEFAPALSDYRQFFSTEVRKTETARFFIDPTCRAPSPPHQLEIVLFDNLAEIFMAGALGECINPTPSAEFGVQALLRIQREKDGWGRAPIPNSIREHVKCSFCAERNGVLCFPNSSPLGDMAGWLTATGSTIEEAIGNLQSYAQELPDSLKCEDKSLAELLVTINKAEKVGIHFTDKPVPPPEIVMSEPS